ncbi:MAG: SRPBCC family protein [Roseivirga sp.]|nr:SRPBCC family protein [Roseivirga sp.]
MSVIIIKLHIKAPPALCFDLARNIDLHQESAAQTREKAIGGVTSGLIEPGQSVTWRAKHFGIWQNLTAKITEFEPPHRFIDEMVEGAFAHFHHEHRFEGTKKGTLMTDTFTYSVPYGLLGKHFDKLILKRYMTRFLRKRNEVIKEHAEKSREH